MTYNLHLSCKHMHLSFKNICNQEHKGVVCNMSASSNSSQSTRPTGQVLWEELLVLQDEGFGRELLVLQDECFGKNYLSYRTSALGKITCPTGRVLWEELLVLQDECFGKNYLSYRTSALGGITCPTGPVL